MLKELRPFLAAVLDGRLKRVSLTITRKRDGIYVETTAFTGKHTFGCASYAHVHHARDKTTTLADVRLTGRRRLGNLWAMLAGQWPKARI